MVCDFCSPSAQHRNRSGSLTGATPEIHYKNIWDFVRKYLDTHPLCSEIGILCLLFTGISSVHGIVLLKLHGLHLLLDGVHCDVVGGVVEES